MRLLAWRHLRPTGCPIAKAKAPELNLSLALGPRGALAPKAGRPRLGHPSAPISCSSASPPTGSGCCSRSMAAIGATCAWIWQPSSGNWARFWIRPASGLGAAERFRGRLGGSLGRVGPGPGPGEAGPGEGALGQSPGLDSRSEGNVVFAFGEIGHQGRSVPGGGLRCRGGRSWGRCRGRRRTAVRRWGWRRTPGGCWPGQEH